jgi:hypothetical protein
MQLIENNVYACEAGHVKAGRRVDCREVSPTVSNRLLVLLGSGLVVVTGPAILGAVLEASLAAIQLLLEIGRVGLIAYQIFGS